MTGRRRAPREVLERLAEAVTTAQSRGWTLPDVVEDPWHDYRAAVAPLRTRAEVDAEIAKTVRGCQRKSDGKLVDGGLLGVARDLCRLCSEPTAQDSGPSSADTEEVPSPRPPVSPAGADLYGPAGVAAAKESRDNAAAPEGAALDEPQRFRCCCDAVFDSSAARAKHWETCARFNDPSWRPESHACNPADRECNCDQALGLEQKLADIRTEYALWRDNRKSPTEALAAIRLILEAP